MPAPPRLESYWFHEAAPESYDRLREEFEWEVPDGFNLADYVCDRHAGEKRRVAVFDEGSAHTFWELRNAANRLANYLEARGVGRGDRVCVNGSQSVETVAGHLAAWKLGAISIPLSVLLGPGGLEYRLSDSGASAFVATADGIGALREVADGIDSLHTVVAAGDADAEGDEVDFADAVASRSRRHDTAPTGPDDDAIMIYTSGTTGRPKGVVNSHSTLLGVLPCIHLTGFNVRIGPGDVGRTVVEWSWAGALIDFVLPHWFYGMPVVARDHGEFDPATEFGLIEEYGVTVFHAPPTALRMMMGADPSGYDLGSVRVVFSGGESVGDTIVEWAADVFGEAVVQEGYGQTEAPAFIGDCAALGVEHRAGKMGKPTPGSDVRILDPDTREPLPAGEIGEIALRYEGNPGCFDRYWEEPEKTAEKVRDGWLLTEDLGVMDEDGYVSFHSRKDDVIISSGYRIGPEEVEDCLAGHEAVADAGVIGVPDDTRGEIPKAFVVLHDGFEPSDDLKEDLQAFVKDRLAKYEYPREIEFIDELPTTTTGKVRRLDLRRREGIEG